MQNSVDKMMQKANASMMLGSSSWLEQFTEAFSVQAGKLVSGHSSYICKSITNFILVQLLSEKNHKNIMTMQKVSTPSYFCNSTVYT